MEFVLIWVALCVGVGLLSRHRGLSFLSGFIWSFILSPIVGLIITVVRKPKRDIQEEQTLADGTKKKCPHCAEFIKSEATVCRYCSRSLAA